MKNHLTENGMAMKDWIDKLTSGLDKINAVTGEQAIAFSEFPDKQDCIFLEPAEALMISRLIEGYRGLE